MTRDTAERARELRELAEEIHVEGQKRCAICFWPLAESTDKGCVRGNCSMRGEAGEYERKSHRAKVEAILEVLKGSALLTQIQAEARDAALEEAAQYFLSDAYIDNEHGGNSPLDLATLVRDLKQRAALAQALQPEEKEK